MSYRIVIDPDRNCIVARFWGDVGFDDLEGARRDVEASPLFRRSLNRLWDERDAVIDLSMEDMQRLSEAWRDSKVDHGPRKLGYIVSSELYWGYNRQFESFRDAPEVDFALFDESQYADLLEFLGLPPDFPDPRELLPGA